MSQNAKRQTKKAPNKNLKLFGALLGIIVVAVATVVVELFVVVVFFLK